jgi:ATP-binding cassette subfamily F protein uup
VADAPVRTGSDSDRVTRHANGQFEVSDKPKAKKLTFKETREFEALELRIAETEKRLPEIEKELTAAASDAGRVHELFLEQQRLNTQLETDLTRWAELAERIEG